MSEKAAFSKGQKIWRIVLLVGVLALSVVLLVNRDKIQHLEAYGYPGIFLLSILSNATVLIPLPGVVFTSAMGAIFAPFWVAIAAGTGAALGELSGYMAGVGGQVWLTNLDWYKRLEGWIQKYNHWPIIFLALFCITTNPPNLTNGKRYSTKVGVFATARASARS